MYSNRIIKKVVADYHRTHPLIPKPEFRTVDQVDELVAYIDSLVDVESNSVNRYFQWKKGKRPTDRRIQWIKEEIENQQFCCFASAEYFVTRYGRIRDVQERIIHIEFRKAQRIFHQILAEYDDRQIAIQLFMPQSAAGRESQPSLRCTFCTEFFSEPTPMQSWHPRSRSSPTSSP